MNANIAIEIFAMEYYVSFDDFSILDEFELYEHLCINIIRNSLWHL